MNKIFWTLLLLILALSLGAQTGLFDIRYDMSREEAIEHLGTEGFEISEENESQIEFIPLDNYYVEMIEIDFADDASGISSWAISYYPQSEEDIEDLVMEALVGRHGEYYDWDDWMETYYWDLGDGHWVYAGWDWDYETYWVEYTTD